MVTRTKIKYSLYNIYWSKYGR